MPRNCQVCGAETSGRFCASCGPIFNAVNRGLESAGETAVLGCVALALEHHGTLYKTRAEKARNRESAEHFTRTGNSIDELAGRVRSIADDAATEAALV